MIKAIYGSEETPLLLGNLRVPCYVLEDGSRVLSGRGIQKALNAPANASGSWLKTFINRQYISSVLNPGLLDKLNNPIEFERIGAGGSQSMTYGYEAAVLIDLCDAILQANVPGSKIDFKIMITCH